jgi:hypothetical protein
MFLAELSRWPHMLELHICMLSFVHRKFTMSAARSASRLEILACKLRQFAIARRSKPVVPPTGHKQRAQHDQTGNTRIKAAGKAGSATDPAAGLTTAQLQELVPGLRYTPVVRHKLQQGSALYREAMRQVGMLCT